MSTLHIWQKNYNDMRQPRKARPRSHKCGFTRQRESELFNGFVQFLQLGGVTGLRGNIRNNIPSKWVSVKPLPFDSHEAQHWPVLLAKHDIGQCW
jgi:hypothetical protein